MCQRRSHTDQSLIQDGLGLTVTPVTRLLLLIECVCHVHNRKSKTRGDRKLDSANKDHSIDVEFG